MQRSVTFRLLPTNKKIRLLEGLAEEMGDLANYIVKKYIEYMHGEVKLSQFSLGKSFVTKDSKFYLGDESELIDKAVYYESIVEKIVPNLKNFVNGKTNPPTYDSFLHFRTRIVEFDITEKSQSWGVTIKHPNERGEYIFIKLAEFEGMNERISNILKKRGKDTFTCEIKKNFNGKWVLSVMFDDGEAPHTPDDIENIIGVDLGLRFVATACVMGVNGEIKETEFFEGGKLFRKRKELNRRMQEVQGLGDKKAYNRLKNKDGEIIKHKNHKVSKDLVKLAERYKPCVIVFEDLEGSKDDLKEKRFKESGDIKGASGRYKNMIQSFWSPSMLKEFVDYKAEEKGVEVYDVNPEYTSQTCPVCGHTTRKNRKNSEHKFICQECDYEINDDLVGAVNIARKGAYNIDVNYIDDLNIKEFEGADGGEKKAPA